MSAGAIFNLVQRDERFDKILQASDYLRERLNRIRVQNAKSGLKNPQPTFADVAKTHNLFVHSTYKPYAATASEYAYVTPSGGDATSLGPGGSVAQFAFPSYGHFTSDIGIRVRIEPIGTAAPITKAGPRPLSLRYRYCALPGVRLLQKVELRSNEVLIDDYTPDDVLLWNSAFLKDDYTTAFERTNGQQQRKTAEIYNSNGFTQVMTYSDGHQTPKFLQPALELVIPLQFWFCRDPAQALLNDMLPTTQRRIDITLAPLTDILQAFDQTGNPVTLPFTRLNIKLSMVVNNLYVNPEIYDIFASRVSVALIRVRRRQVTVLNTTKAKILHDQLKFPAEFIITAVRDPANRADFDNWALYGRRVVRTPATQLLVPAAVWNAEASLNQLVIGVGSEATTLEPIVETLGVSTRGIDLYVPTNVIFYNSYLQQRYFQTSNVVASEDTSVFFIPFCVYPGTFSPSGYYNLSTGRELYISYRGSSITSQTPAEMVTTMSALNFLIRKGDSFALRYSV